MAEYNLEGDIVRLKTENATLREEVAQLQADKEFVWSLWKRLQVASPDLTQAIAEVVRREKEKAEVKDRKVLQILQLKDSRIGQLEKLVIERNAEIKTLIEGKICLEERITRLQIENQEYSDKLNFQDDQIRSRDNKEKTVGHLHKQLVGAFEKEKVDLQKQLSEQNSANSILKAQNADLSAVKSVQETKISSIQQELIELRGQYDKILCEFEDAKKKVYKYDVDVRQLELQLDYKDAEMANLKKELDELWTTHQQCKNHAAEQASVINQLQSLQQETQKMLQTQSDSHQIEFQSLNAMYKDASEKLTEAKNLEIDCRNEIENLKQTVVSKDERIQELSTGVRERTVKLQTQLVEVDDFGSQVTALVLEQDYKVHSLETERDMLKERLREKNRALKNVQKENVVDLDLDLTPVKLCAPHKLIGKDAKIQLKYDSLEKRYRNAQQLLKLKSKEVHELRAAHTKRLERLKNVQSNYEIVKNQLEALEEEYYGPAREDHKSKRCDAKSLRVGDSDKVWNELSYYKQENKALMAERLQLQEELDICKVQSVQDSAEIHELRVMLEQAKEDRKNAIDDRDRLLEPDENIALQLKSTKYELFGKESALESVEKEKNELSRKCEVLDSERRKVRQELNNANRELAEKRIQLCDVKEQLRKVQKMYRKLKRGRVVMPRRGVSWESDRVLDKSDGHDDGDWEEINETGIPNSESETDVTLTSASEDVALPCAPTARQIESIEAHIERQRKVETPKQVPHRRRVELVRKSVLMKDVATSPHKYNDRVRRTFNTGLRNQLRNVRSRLMNTQQQLKNCRREKMIAEKNSEEQKAFVDNLQRDLLSANQRLRTMRANHQRLVTENETLLTEKAVLEKKAANVAAFFDEKNVTSSPRESPDDRKMLESRLKISAAECSKQLLLIKNLRVEMEEKELKITELTDKVNRLERDTAQKRLLLEDSRLRLKLSQEQLQANHAVIEELNSQVRVSSLTLERQKVNVESAKKRAQASIKEKREYERLYQQTVEKHEDTKFELEKTASALSQTKVKLAAKEREINEIEEAAHEQMRHTVSKSEAAIEIIQKKIQNYQKRLNTYKRFVEGLSQRILRSTQNARSVMTGKMNEKINQSVSTESLKRASDVAKNILNIDQDELDDIMGCKTAIPSAELNENDQRWRENCQKLMNEKADFSVTLADLMMEKIEEQFRLLSGLVAAT